MKEKVAIVFGGTSVEHDISIITAVQTMAYLPDEYSFVPIYIDKDGLWWTADNLNDIKVYQNFQKKAKAKKQVSLVLGKGELLAKKNGKFSPYCKLSTVLNCCHGRIGEDGCVQGVFECCNLAQTSCAVTSSALCMDKSFMKDVFSQNNILSPKYVTLRKCEYEQNKKDKLAEIEKKLQPPVVVKPANLGSSIGISFCEKFEELDEAISLALSFDRKVVIEEAVKNLREFNCACLSYRGELITSIVNEVKNKTNIFTFEDKYISEHASGREVDKTLSKKVKKLTERVYDIFDCRGVVRIDFLYDEHEKMLYVNEINSIPGSLAFYLFKEIPFKELLRALIEESFSVEDEKRRLLTTFESDALKIFEEVQDQVKK